MPDSEILVVTGDLNGDAGKHTDKFESIHGGKGYSNHDCDGARLWDIGRATI